MKGTLVDIIDQSIRIELNASEIYCFFHHIFAEDKNFWWQLCLEEKNHAALLKSGSDYFLPHGTFPHKIICDNLDELKATNAMLVQKRKEFEDNHPSREEAFTFALVIEETAGEFHFQQVMSDSDGSRELELFKQLNKEDKDHAIRIRLYMEQHGIIESA